MAGETVDILVVEDSPTQAQHLARLLASEPGWKVRIAGDGSSALAEVARRRPQLIVSDVAMPGMDGFTLCRTLKDDPVYANLPVVLLTSLASLKDIVQALESGADSFVRNPTTASSCASACAASCRTARWARPTGRSNSWRPNGTRSTSCWSPRMPRRCA